MLYEVTAENALPIRFILEIFIEHDEVNAAMVQSEGPGFHHPGWSKSTVCL